MPIFRPGKPALRAVLSADQVIPTAVFTKVAFDLEYYGEGNVDLVAGGLVVGLSGRYLITAGILRRAQATSYSLDTQLLVGAVVVFSHFTERSVQLASQSLADVITLAAGDEVSIKCRGALNAGATSTIAASSYVGIVRIGPLRWT